MNKEPIVGIVLFLLLIAVMVVIYSISKQPATYIPFTQYNGTYSNNNNQGSGYVSVPVELSDPSYLPSSTSALSLIFSNISVYVEGQGWVKGGGFGPINIARLGNASEVISIVSLPYNSVLNTVRLNVSQAEITVGGVIYNIALPEGSIMVHTVNGIQIDGGKAVLIDLSPIIIGKNNSENSMQMRYSARAYGINGSALAYQGSRVAVPAKLIRFDITYPKIQLSNVSLYSSGDNIHLGFDLGEISGPQSSVTGVVVAGGGEQFSYDTSMINQSAFSYAAAILKKYNISTGGIGGLIFNTSTNGSTGNPYSSINSSVYNKAVSTANTLGGIIISNLSSLFKLGGSISSGISTIGSSSIKLPSLNGAQTANTADLTAQVYAAMKSTLYSNLVASTTLQGEIGTLPFNVNGNGLLTPSWTYKGGGIIISQGGLEHMGFDGRIAFGNETSITVQKGNNYAIFVIGSNGVLAEQQVTAG